MAVPLSVECHGKNYSYRLTPMATLGSLIPGVLKLASLDEKVKPEECKLLLKDKLLDHNLPCRFANISSTAKILLKTGHEPVLGVIDKPDSTASLTNHPSLASSQGQGQAADRDAIPATNNKTTTTATTAAPPSRITPASDTQQQQQQIEDEKSTIENRIYVFTRDAELQSIAAQSTTTDLDDTAYEVTERDLRLIMAGYTAKRKDEEGVLMTKKMRDAQLAKKIAEYGAIPIRFEFSDGIVIQASYTASSCIQELYTTIKGVLLPQFQSQFYLFTSPPKQELVDKEMTFYSSGLVPAARVHVGFRGMVVDEGGAAGCMLREEVMAQLGEPPMRLIAARKKNSSGGALGGGLEGGEAEGRDRGGPSSTGGGAQQRRKGNVPSWMKLSK